MTFNYAEAYNGNEPEAYETLLEDVIEGNPTLFMRSDQVEAAWQVITPILKHGRQDHQLIFQIMHRIAGDPKMLKH